MGICTDDSSPHRGAIISVTRYTYFLAHCENQAHLQRASLPYLSTVGSASVRKQPIRLVLVQSPTSE